MRAPVAAMSLTLTLTACGASTGTRPNTTPSTFATGIVAGRVTAGPTCPVERPDHPCPPAAVSATVEARNVGASRVVASTRTDAHGRYQLRIRAGTYTVDAVTPNALPRCSRVNITVRANRTARATISCDTGIR
jgi:hypothetical protein